MERVKKPPAVARTALERAAPRGGQQQTSAVAAPASSGHSFADLSVEAKAPASGRAAARKPGKEVLDDLTRPGWMPQGSETLAGKKAITGAELKLLMKGAVESAWKTYAYHATKSANAQSIADSGLDPRRGGTGASKGSEALEEQSRGHVHYTRQLGLAKDYKAHLAGDPRPFPKLKVETPEDAEVLQVAIHAETGAREEVDPDQTGAYRTRSRIPGKYIRRLAPAPIPAKPDSRKKVAPLVRGASKRAWAEHVSRGRAEDAAFLSNMPIDTKVIMYDMMKRGLDVTTMLQLIRQGLRSMSTDAILEWTPENEKLNQRLRSDLMDPTGQPLRDKA
jgi:hypothetical protein